MPRSSRSLSLCRKFRAGFIFFISCLLFLLGLLPARAAAAPAGPLIDTDPGTGNLTIFDPTTSPPTLIPQFPATDAGSGKLVTILWVLFGIVVGAPMGVFGIRGGRLSTGAACGLVATVTMWAAFINSLSAPLADTPATADLVLTLILFASFAFFTFLGSFLRAMHPLGLGLIGAVGGTSLFMRVVIFKRNLLLSVYPLNLALLALGGVLGVVFIIWKRRLSILFATSLLSTFLLGLSIDLVLNINAPQGQGISRGLRFLMDRNSAHLADIVGTKYSPTLKTQIILGVSLALVPVLAYAQHRLFPGPFTYNLRHTPEDRVWSLYEEAPGPDFSAGRPLNMAGTGKASTSLAKLPISGPMFGAVGHGSRFST